MTEAIAFDTHRFVKNLTAGGFTEKQAEVLADEQVRLLDGNLATKADLGRVKANLERVKGELQAEIHAVDANLQSKIHAVEANLEARIQTIKADLLKWMVGAMTAQTGVIVGLIVGLVRFF